MKEYIFPSVTQKRSYASPEEIFGTLFADVQNSHQFEDSKTFADAIPLKEPALIMEAYDQEKQKPGFDMAGFVRSNFSIPAHIASTFVANKQGTVSEHVEKLWAVLTRQPDDQESGCSLIPLPHPYVVPGGRFREIYY